MNLLRRLRNWLFNRQEEYELVTEPEHEEVDYGKNPRVGRLCCWCGVIRTPKESRYDRCSHCRKFKTRLEALVALRRKTDEYLERERRRRHGEL